MSFVVFDPSTHDQSAFFDTLKKEFPERTAQPYSDKMVSPEKVDYALVWKPPAQLFEDLPNLKAVFNLGAGVDALLESNVVPEHLPIIRLIDPMLNQGMMEYVTWAVLRYHRLMPLYEDQQKKSNWTQLPATDARKTRVGILGFGELGQACADVLKAFNFQIMGWSRSQKSHDGVTCYAGAAGLDEMLSQSDILVCLLPLTPETEGILNKDLCSKLPRGAKLIHVARGKHMISNDIVKALDNMQLSHVTLDVFPEEPLPTEHPLWQHPQVTITPHIASQTLPYSSIERIAENVRRLESGEAPLGLVDRTKGY